MGCLALFFRGFLSVTHLCNIQLLVVVEISSVIPSGETESRGGWGLPQRQAYKDNQDSWQARPLLHLGRFGPWLPEKPLWRGCCGARWRRLQSEQPALQKEHPPEQAGELHPCPPSSPASQVFQAPALAAAVRKRMALYPHAHSVQGLVMGQHRLFAPNNCNY